MQIFKQFFIPCLIISMVAVVTKTGYSQTTNPDNNQTHVFLPLVVSTTPEAVAPQVQVVPNQYIVVLQDDVVTSASVSSIASELATLYGATVQQTYDTALTGFTMNLPTDVITEALSALQQDIRVESVEQDQVMTIVPVEQNLADPGQEMATASATEATQPNAPWGLDRIDQRNLPLDNQYRYNNNGAGVKVYIIDSGIRASHAEFEGRVTFGYDAIDGSLPADDCFGHGTHVAAIVGGKTYGVAKRVQLVAVRVLDCKGEATVSEVIAGVNWVTQQRKNNPNGAMVANMSLGGPITAALDKAVTNSIKAGITYVVAAGNNYGLSACNLSPARVPTAITVGATSAFLDFRALYSNIGSCLDLFAPGSTVPSAWYTNDSAVATLSGTSMATPHVAGAAALYLQSHPNANPNTVANALIANVTTNAVLLAGSGSPNRLLFVPQSQ